MQAAKIMSGSVASASSSTGEPFRDLGESYLDQVARKRSTAKLVQRLSNLGYDITLVPKTA